MKRKIEDKDLEKVSGGREIRRPDGSTMDMPGTDPEHPLQKDVTDDDDVFKKD